MVDPTLPETVSKEAHILRQMSLDLASRVKVHNQKIRAHLHRLMCQGLAFVAVQSPKADLRVAKVLGPVGESRALVEFSDGLRLNIRLEFIASCLTEAQFRAAIEAATLAEHSAAKSAKERLHP